jgi:hypothetical protein
MKPSELFDETFRRCMPQATKPFYTEITKIEETKTSVVADVILFDGGRATFEVTKPDVIGCYGFSCPSNDGAAFEWKDGSWRRCVLKAAA